MQWENGQRSHVQFYWHGPTLLSEEETRVEHGSEHSHGTQYVFKPGSFEPVAQVRDGQVQHIHTDHLGTPRELSNSQGQWVWKARYRSYGGLALKDDSAKEQNPAACKLRFQGQYWDEESGLHYNLNRYYDPESGQFTTQDPIGLAGGLNVYQYAPNPVTWVDPWGLTCKEGIDRPDFYVQSDGTAIPRTFHRYANSKFAPIGDARSGLLPEKRGGMYVSFDKIDDAIVASDKLQIPYRPDFRVSGDSLSVIDRMEVPKGNWGTSKSLEPITKDFKKFGPGKATQVLIRGEVPVDPSSLEILR